MNKQKSVFQQQERRFSRVSYLAPTMPHSEKQRSTSTIKTRMRTTMIGLSALLCLFMVTSVQAFPGPLNLTTQFPDILVSDLDIGFSASTGNLTADDTNSSTFSFTDSNNQNFSVNGLSYNLDINLGGVNNDTFLGGTIAIVGGVPGLTIPDNSTLLSGNITDFGAAGGGPVGNFEFLFDVVASEAALGFGSQGGTIISSFNLSPGFSMTADFGGVGNSDNFSQAQQPVPEPPSLVLVLFATGYIALFGIGRRQRIAYLARANPGTPAIV